MFRRAKTQPSPPTASWRRELLQPAINSLIGSAGLGAIVVDALDGSFLLKMTLLGAVLIPVLFPRVMISGNKLFRPSENQPPLTTFATRSPLQRVSNGDYGPKSADDYEEDAPLPEIVDVPPFVQKLICNLGAPIPLSRLPQALSKIFNVLNPIIWIGLFVIFGWLFIYEKSLNEPHVLIALGTFLALMILMSYRRAFRHLYDIYTADAAKTGRHAFPALRR